MMDKFSANESGFFSDLRTAEVSWRDFFGSSLSLAPTLLSMYDELSMSSNKTSLGGDEDMEDERRCAIHLNHALPDQATYTDNIVSLSKTSPSSHFRNETDNGRSDELLEDKNNNSSVQNLRDLDLSLADNNDALTWSTTPVSNVGITDDSTVTSTGGSLLLEEVDDKKRPLSVMSTSSSSSSTCSMSSNRRKKHASCTMASCSVVPSSLSGVSVVSDSLATVSEVSSSNSTCGESACCRAFDDCSVNYSGASSSEGNPSYQRGRFRSFSGCTTQMLTGGIWNKMLPAAKSDTDVMAIGTTDTVTEIDTGQALVNSEEETASIPTHSESQYIDRVVMEILETERKYVKDLKDIIDGYVNYLSKSSEFDLQPTDQDALFGNIQDIYVFNRNFLRLLEEFGHDPTGVAKCFVNQTDGFAIYSEYCTNYPRSMEVLTDCMKDSVKASILKRQQMALRHALPLGSYLLKPVQRILKYHLLLLNILNHHDVASDGHKTIEQAVESMTSMARHINDMKQRHEHAIRTQEIQSMLYEWDGSHELTTLGDLILEDKFRVYGAKAERSVFLFEKAVLIAKRKDEGSLVVKAFIMNLKLVLHQALRYPKVVEYDVAHPVIAVFISAEVACYNLMLIESIPKEPLCFHMIPFDCPRIQYTVKARSLDQKRLWCQHLKQLILDNYSAAIPEKAKELVMTLGKSREEELLGSSVENVDHVRKQHSAPQYLQKRRRKSAGLIPDFKLKPRSGPRKSEPSTQAGPLMSPQVRRNSDIVEFLGEALKNKEKSGLSPRLGLMKKAYFWSKYGTENSNLALDTSVESIKSSLAAHSAEAVCSYSNVSQSTDTDSSLADNSDGLSVSEDASKLAESSPTMDRLPKDWKSGIPTIRVTSIAHKDSFTLSKTRHANSSATLGSKDPCRQRCIKVKSKSTAELDFQMLSGSVIKNLDARGDRKQCVEYNATDSVGLLPSDSSKDNEGQRPCNELRVILTSEDNLSTDLLADTSCTDERNDLGDDASETSNECADAKRVHGNPGSVDGARFQRVQQQSGDKRVSEEVLETSSDWLCSKCGCSLPPSFNHLDKSSDDCNGGETSGDYGRLSPLLCLDCASSKLESEMAQLEDWCNASGNDSDQNAGSSSEESIENSKETMGSDVGSDGCEEKGFQFQLEGDLYTLKEDQLEELARHLMRSQEMLLNANEGLDAVAAGTVQEDTMDLPIVVPSAGSDGSCLFNIQQLKQKVEDNGVSTHSSLETDSRKPPEETEGSANGIVDSFRSTVANFLSKLTHKNSMDPGRCSPGSPRRGMANATSGESPKTPSHCKDARYRFVYTLARAYSSRSKLVEVGRDGNPEKVKLDKARGEQLTVLLKGKELGSEIIGERMAQATPHTLDRTLSLVPNKNGKRKAQIAKNNSPKSPEIVRKDSALSDKENADQLVKGSGSSLQVDNASLVASVACRIVDDHDVYSSGKGSEEEEKKHAFECYYEKQLSLDLEEGSSAAEYGTAPS